MKTVHFIRTNPPYAAGDTATLPKDTAATFIAAGIAQGVESTKVAPAAPPASAALKGAVKKG